VRCVGLRQAFGATVAVDGLDLEVAEGEVFGLLGPNGAGKTTTIRLITTLLPAPPGAITVLGLDVARRRMAVRRVLGYLPQQLSADATLTGRENVALFARLYDVPRRERAAQVQAVLDAVDLADVADRLAKTYSGGMVRRLELAQAAGQRAAGADTGRADGRARPGGPRRRVGPHPRDPAGHRHDRARHHARHAGGRRALRPDRAHAPRPHPALGTPGDLKGAIGPDATLDDVFRRHTGDTLAAEGDMRDVRAARRTAGRLG
jgi:ABC-2 type transport system ATP-binding protein